VGTVAFALGVGPLVGFFLPRLAPRPPVSRVAAPVASGACPSSS
jgi:hypothetical protein